MSSFAQLDELKDLVDHFQCRKVRAAERLKSSGEPACYFAILGLQLDADDFAFGPVAQLAAVEEPPGEIELASALEQQHLFGAVGRYSHSIRYELRIPVEEGKEQFSFTLAWWIVSLIRVRTSSEILIPAVADYSWSTIAGAPSKSCRVQLLEDVPLAKNLGAPVVVTREDLLWVEENLTSFAGLLEQPKFRLAVDSLTTHHLQHSERMMAAMLWAGIEALFGIQSELRFRLAVLLATVLEPSGGDRLRTYRRVKKLYDTRSKAVHGAPIGKANLHEHVVEVRQFLGRLLCRLTEQGKLPSEEELEEELFGEKDKNA